MFNFLQNIFDKAISLMATAIIAIGLISAPSTLPASNQSLSDKNIQENTQPIG